MSDQPRNGVRDGLQNFAARIGLGTDNQMWALTELMAGQAEYDPAMLARLLD